MVATVGRRSELAYRPRHMAPPPPPKHLRRPDPLRQLRPLRPLAAAVALVTVTAVAALVVVDRPMASRSDGTAPAPLVPVAAAGAVDPRCVDEASVSTRAGLVLVVGLPGVTRADEPPVDLLAEVGVGGVMLRDDNLTGPRQAAALVTGLRARLGSHLLVALDEEGGRVTSMRALGHVTPSARRLGRAGADAASEAGADLGEAAHDIGVDWVFAPVLDLDDGPASGVIGDRSFGDDPDDVAEVADAFADGLHDAGVAVALKHFPGHGAADHDPHASASVDDRSLATLLRRDVRPFDALIEAGAEAVMVGHVTYPNVWGDVPASLSSGAYRLLRERGFDGVAITDALGMGAVYNRSGFDQAPTLAIAAGADAVLVNQGDRVLELRDGLVAAVTSGRLDEARLNQAVARMLVLRGQPAAGVLCA